MVSEKSPRVGDNGAPLVSVIMPTFNHAPYVSDAIISVYRQTYPHWELIIVDDGSTDQTVEIIRNIIAKSGSSHRVCLVTQNHKGPTGLSISYNTALRHARGDLIAILEGDDLWPDYKLQVQVPDFANKNIVLSFGDYAWVDPRGHKIRTVCLAQYLPPKALTNEPLGTAAWYMAGLAHRTFTFPCTVVMRRSALEAVGGFHGLSGSVNLVDFPTFLRLSLIGRFVYHNLILGYWRRHLRSLTTTLNVSIAGAAFTHAMEFLAAHPDCQRGAVDEVYRSWRRVLASARFAEARAKLVAEDWDGAVGAFRQLLLQSSVPLELRCLSFLGILAGRLRFNIESVMRILRGYDLRRIKDSP